MIFVQGLLRLPILCTQADERGKVQIKKRGARGMRGGCGEIVYSCSPNIYSPVCLELQQIIN